MKLLKSQKGLRGPAYLCNMKTKHKYFFTVRFPKPYESNVYEVDWFEVEAYSEEEGKKIALKKAAHRLSIITTSIDGEKTGESFGW